MHIGGAPSGQNIHQCGIFGFYNEPHVRGSSDVYSIGVGLLEKTVHIHSSFIDERGCAAAGISGTPGMFLRGLCAPSMLLKFV